MGGRRRGDVRRGEVVDKHDGTLAEGEDGVGLDLGVGGEDALGQPRDDGLGEGEVLLGRVSATRVEGGVSSLGVGLQL